MKKLDVFGQNASENSIVSQANDTRMNEKRVNASYLRQMFLVWKTACRDDLLNHFVHNTGIIQV